MSPSASYLVHLCGVLLAFGPTRLALAKPTPAASQPGPGARPSGQLVLSDPRPAPITRHAVVERGPSPVYFRSQRRSYVPLQTFLGLGGLARLNGPLAGGGGFVLDAGINGWFELERAGGGAWRWSLYPELAYTLCTGPGPLENLAGPGLGLGLQRRRWFTVSLTPRFVAGARGSELGLGLRTALRFALNMKNRISSADAYNASEFPLGLEVAHRWIRSAGASTHDLQVVVYLAFYALVSR